VPQKRPTARDVEASSSLKRDLLSFRSALGEPVTAPHVVHTWPLGWTVGSIGGDALRMRCSSSGVGGRKYELPK